MKLLSDFIDRRIGFTAVLFLAVMVGNLYADRVTVDGNEYRSARMTEVCREGIIFKTKEDGFVVLVWAEVTEAQVKSLKSREEASLLNALYHGYFVKGTVFDVNDDGVVIQISEQDKNPEPYCRQGAEILTDGFVIIKDLPSEISKEKGAEIEIVAYKHEIYSFVNGDDTEKIPYLTASIPFWATEQEWKNTGGQAMMARFIALKGRVCYFEKAGKKFEYPLDKLDAEGKARAEEYQKNVEGFPFP